MGPRMLARVRWPWLLSTRPTRVRTMSVAWQYVGRYAVEPRVARKSVCVLQSGDSVGFAMSFGALAPVIEVRSGTSSCSLISKMPAGSRKARTPSVRVHGATGWPATQTPALIGPLHISYLYR